MAEEIIARILKEGCFERIAPHKAKNDVRIMVAMSGGVDSSVVAAILHSAGYQVVGVTMRLYSLDPSQVKTGACCAGIDIGDAKGVAQQLGFPHYVLNYEKVFKEKVINYFVEEYIDGRTPIPCIKCNEDIKFDVLVKNACEIGCDALVTGHYVKKIFQNDRFELHQGDDPQKDQSYFLFATTREQLDYVYFPLGGTTKTETRQVAEYYNLKVAKKRESQDICFVSKKYNDVVQKFSQESKRGDILDEQGKIIGQHNGIIHYTIGQRRGIQIAGPHPLYVVRIDAKSNQIVVGPRSSLEGHSFKIANINLLDEEIPRHAKVKIRSMAKLVTATLSMKENLLTCTLEEPQLGITPGQACVFYHEKRLLGGGWIQ